MKITIKLQLKVANTGEQREKANKLLRHYHNSIYRIKNFIVNNIYLNSIIEDKFMYHDKRLKEKIESADNKIKELYRKKGRAEHKLKEEEDKDKAKKLKTDIKKIKQEIDKRKKNKSKLTKESNEKFREQFKKLYNIEFNSSIGQYIRSEFPDIHDTIISPAISELNFYKNEIWKVKAGWQTIKTFKKGIPFNTRGSDLEFFEENGDVYIKWVKGIVFKIRFGQDRSNNKEIIRRVLNKEYKVCGSSISYGSKIFLNLCLDIPQKATKLDEDKVLGVDLGVAIPAYISTNKGYFRKALGSAEDFLRIRLQMQSRRRRLQKKVSLARGAHGRKRKLQALTRLKEKERNWVRTYNHKLSKEIVKAAEKERCRTINLEFLKGYGKNASNSFILRNWSYYELQQFIEYKAKKVGIDVAYVDPYHTSQTCSKCGHYEPGQRPDQETFECKKCGFKDNADYNASKNIAKSTAYVNDKSECQYFINQKKKSQ